MEELQQLKSFEDACRILGYDAENILPDLSRYPAKHQLSTRAHDKLVIIVEAANFIANGNKEWLPNFLDTRQAKYEIWWRRGSSGFRFYGVDDWGTYSAVGSRLSFISEGTAEYVAGTFEALYNEYL